MRHDENLKLLGDKVVLVPYREVHVPKYHEWMGDPEILRLTGSERLSLEEEYKMQQSWAQDANKCTFIILSREIYEETNDEIKSMVGDTNLFFSQEDDEKEAEIEIMIAEKSARRKGFAKEALTMMMTYGREHLHFGKYVAKIKDDNASSIHLFEGLGYKFSSRSDVFHEVTLVLENNTL